MSDSPMDADQIEYDPVFLNSRREAIVIFCLWAVGLIWAVPFCYLTGYVTGEVNGDNLNTIFGIPTWLFWGIFIPWIVADVFTTWFCFCYMKDDDLGEELENDGDPKEQVAKDETPEEENNE